MANSSTEDCLPSLSGGALRGLRRDVSGSLVLPHHSRFLAESTCFERSVAHDPALIAVARSSEDIAACVRFAEHNGLGVAVQASGHGMCVPVDRGGLLVNTRRLRGVLVHPEARVARVQAGAQWSDVIKAASSWGLAPLHCGPLSSSAVSSILGGGIGPLARRYGQTSDHVRDLVVVTADGSQHVTSARENTGLFWGLRGSRGSLGVVTSATVDLFPVPAVFAGSLCFDPADARRVLERYVQWAEELPETVASRLSFRRVPADPRTPHTTGDALVVRLLISATGSGPELDRLVRPLMNAAPIVGNSLRWMPYAAAARVWDDVARPMPTRSRVLMLRRLGDDAVRIIEAYALHGADAPFSLDIHHMGGALARRAASCGAVGHFPDTEFAMHTVLRLDPARDMSSAVRAQDALVDALAPWAGPKTSPGFLAGLDVSDGCVRAAYGASWDALRALKAAYDPDDMFRFTPFSRPDGPRAPIVDTWQAGCAPTPLKVSRATLDRRAPTDGRPHLGSTVPVRQGAGLATGRSTARVRSA